MTGGAPLIGAIIDRLAQRLSSNGRGFETSASTVSAEIDGLQQRFWVCEDARFGPTAVRAHVETDAGPSPRAKPHEISAFNRSTSLSCLIELEDGRHVLHACVDVSGGNSSWSLPLLELTAELQLADAPRAEAWLRTSGDDAKSVARDDTRSEDPKRPMLSGPEASIWGRTGELEILARALNEGNAFAQTDGASLTAELPFGAAATSLLHVSTFEQLLDLGSGLALQLFLPPSSAAQELAAMAADLNAAERAGECPGQGVGAWCVAAPPMAAGAATLSFRAFCPIDAHRPGLLANLGLAFAIRARWAGCRITGDENETDVASLVRQRMRALMKPTRPRKPSMPRSGSKKRR